tara:strand:+ start:16737 stop:16850 length:114 start_codon:yes stop_codon:yes gene_type:complete
MKTILLNTIGVIAMAGALYLLLTIIKLGEMFAQFITA